MNRNKIRWAALAAAAMLALAGCSASAEPAPETPVQPSSAATSDLDADQVTAGPELSIENTSETPELTEWSNDAVNRFLGAVGARSFAGLANDYHEVVEYRATEVGNLEFVVTDEYAENDEVYEQNLGPANKLYGLAVGVFQGLTGVEHDIEQITIRTVSGDRVEVVTRDEAPKV